MKAQSPQSHESDQWLPEVRMMPWEFVVSTGDDVAPLRSELPGSRLTFAELLIRPKYRSPLLGFIVGLFVSNYDRTCAGKRSQCRRCRAKGLRLRPLISSRSEWARPSCVTLSFD